MDDRKQKSRKNQRKSGLTIMRIDFPGKYLARDDKIVDIFRVDRTTAVGRHPDDTQAMVWDAFTGEAIGHSLQHSLIEFHPPADELRGDLKKPSRKSKPKPLQ